MRITSQSQQYGLPEKEARALPSAREVADLMRGPGIPHGTMSREAAEELEEAEGKHRKDDLPWQEQAKPHYVYRQPGDSGHQERPDFSRGGNKNPARNASTRMASGGDWVHAHELQPDDLVTYSRGSGRASGDHQRNRVSEVRRTDGPEGPGTHVGFADGAYATHSDATSQPSYYRHNFN